MRNSCGWSSRTPVLRDKEADTVRKYLTEYLAQITALLESGEVSDYEELQRRHLTMIQFMQHERLVHFLVTMLFALGFFIVLGIFLVCERIMLLPLLVLILALLIPYIAHYYFLENSVQKLYFINDQINVRRQKQKAEEAAGEPRKEGI